MTWLTTGRWVLLALLGLLVLGPFLDELKKRRLFAAPRLTAVILWYFAILWPFFEPEFKRVHWLWLLPMSFFVPTLIQHVRRSWALFGFVAGPWRNPPQYWSFTIGGSLLAYYLTLQNLSARPLISASCLIGGTLAGALAISMFDKILFRLPASTKENWSVIRSRLNWIDRMRFGTVGQEIAGELKPEERVLAVAKGPHSFRTMNSRPQDKGPGLLIVTTLRVFVSGVRSSDRLEIPIEELIVLQDLCPTDPPTECHTVEVMTEIDCVDGTSLSGRDSLTITFAVPYEAAREVDAAARTFWKDDEASSAE